MDRYGLNIFLPTEQRNATVLELLRARLRRPDVPLAGLRHPDRQRARLVSRRRWSSSSKAARRDGGWSMTLLFEEIIPALKEGGATDAQIETMMVENPKRWLTA